MSLPSVEAIRQRIQQTSKPEAKYTLMAAYLFCARISEIVTRTCPSDIGHTQARGPTPQDLTFTTFELGPIKEEAAIFTIYTAKRGGRPRKIALPLNPNYEPLTKQLVAYFQTFNKKDPIFNLTRQKATAYAKQVFTGYNYPIDEYTTKKDGELTKVPYHLKPFRSHALRHLRATELIETYDLNGFEMSIYGGWTLKTMAGVGSAMGRYAHLQWKKYFPKLLKPRN